MPRHGRPLDGARNSSIPPDKESFAPASVLQNGRVLFTRARDEILVAGLFSLFDGKTPVPTEQAIKQFSLSADINGMHRGTLLSAPHLTHV